MAQAEAEAPGREHLVVVAFATVSLVVGTHGGAVVENGIVLGGQVVPCWCVYIEADAEGRLLDGTEDGAKLDVESCACNLAVVVDGEFSCVLACAVDEAFSVDAVALVVDIIESESDAEEHAVVEVAADVEVVLADIARVGAVKVVAAGLVVSRSTRGGVCDEGVPEQVVQLREVGRRVGTRRILIANVFACGVLVDEKSTLVDVAQHVLDVGVLADGTSAETVVG